jgi:hypothetical protein
MWVKEMMLRVVMIWRNRIDICVNLVDKWKMNTLFTHTH